VNPHDCIFSDRSVNLSGLRFGPGNKVYLTAGSSFAVLSTFSKDRFSIHEASYQREDIGVINRNFFNFLVNLPDLGTAVKNLFPDIRGKSNVSLADGEGKRIVRDNDFIRFFKASL
jgi:transcriptional accessory protein Tex/SPT6